MRPSLHFIDLKAIACVVGRVYDQGCWSFIDRSGPMAHIEMASPPSLSQCSDVTNFLTSDNSDSALDSSQTSSSPSSKGSPMDVDTSSMGSSG